MSHIELFSIRRTEALHSVVTSTKESYSEYVQNYMETEVERFNPIAATSEKSPDSARRMVDRDSIYGEYGINE